MGFKFGFQVSKWRLKNTLEDRPFFNDVQPRLFTRKFLYKILVEHGRGFCGYNIFDRSGFQYKIAGEFNFFGSFFFDLKRISFIKYQFCVDKHAKYNCQNHK